MEVEKILGSPKSFLENIFYNLKKDEIDVLDYELDHICYRVETIERNNQLKNELQKIGDLISENKINGRLIPLIKLKDPIIFEDRKIYLVELPQPKEDHHFKEGFEHVEFVISESFDNFMEKYKDLKFKTDGINKEINADIVRQYKDCVVKFHHQSLEYVVKYLQK